jgi:hypothetical protein
VIPVDLESVGGADTVVKGAIVGVKIWGPVTNGADDGWYMAPVESESVGRGD